MKRVNCHSHTGPVCNSLGAHGLIVPWTEFEQHKLVDYGVLNAGFKGVTLIEVKRLYEVGRDGTDRCAPNCEHLLGNQIPCEPNSVQGEATCADDTIRFLFAGRPVVLR